MRPTPVSFVYVNHDEYLCSDGTLIVHTNYTGHVCNDRDDVKWTSLETVDPRPGISPAACHWTGAGSADPSVAYSGDCGVAPAGNVGKGGRQNATSIIPVWLCPPEGFVRAAVGGVWANASPVPVKSVEECAEKCASEKYAAEPLVCHGFAVSDNAGCSVFLGGLHGPFSPRLNTSTFVAIGSAPLPPPPPASVPISLKRWTMLRPSTGAQPAAFRGVLAPRLPPPIAAAWARSGLRPLDIVEHFATESTMPVAWPTYASEYVAHTRASF